MPLIVMLLTLSGSYGFTGGAPVIQGFKTLAGCERAIPTVRQFYGKGTVEKAQCLSLAAE
jgi:hypothetical protein